MSLPPILHSHPNFNLYLKGALYYICVKTDLHTCAHTEEFTRKGKEIDRYKKRQIVKGATESFCLLYLNEKAHHNAVVVVFTP